MILAHFPGELASFTVFCSVFKRRQEYVKLAPGFVASERTCSYQFSWLQTVKKNIHIGIFDFWLECDFPKCGTAATTSQNRCSALSARLKNARPIPDGVPALEGRAEKQRGNPGSTPQQRFQRCENFAAPE